VAAGFEQPQCFGDRPLRRDDLDRPPTAARRSLTPRRARDRLGDGRVIVDDRQPDGRLVHDAHDASPPEQLIRVVHRKRNERELTGDTATAEEPVR
jgi:hypothetical protein